MEHLVARDEPIQDEGPNILGVSVGLMAFGFLLVAVRLGYRLRSTGIKTDDVLITLAVVFSLGHSVDDCISVIQYGYGKHEKDLTPAQAEAGKTTGAALGFWISQLFYKMCLLCTKLSICFLYRRIFERANKAFNIALYTVMGLVGGYYIAVVLATIFECTPVSKSWIKKQPGTCINTTAFFYSNAGFNILTDVVIMALPIPVIYALHLPLRQRLLLCCVFAVGLFATATSVIRIFTLSTAGKGGDTTWVVAGSTLWSSVEMNVAIICACLPMLRPPLQAIFPRIFGTRSSRRSKYMYGSTGRDVNSSRGSEPGNRFSKRWSRSGLATPSGAAKSVDVQMQPTQETETVASEKTSSDDEPYFLSGHDDDNEGIMRRLDVLVSFEERSVLDNQTLSSHPRPLDAGSDHHPLPGQAL